MSRSTDFFKAPGTIAKTAARKILTEECAGTNGLTNASTHLENAVKALTREVASLRRVIVEFLENMVDDASGDTEVDEAEEDSNPE